MQLDVIRRFVNVRPFKPLVFHIDNGEKQVIKHPEIIVTADMIIAVDDEGLPVIIAPEAVSSIHRAKNTTRRARRDSKRTISKR